MAHIKFFLPFEQMLLLILCSARKQTFNKYFADKKKIAEAQFQGTNDFLVWNLSKRQNLFNIYLAKIYYSFHNRKISCDSLNLREF